jgi:hypothetical protein
VWWHSADNLIPIDFIVKVFGIEYVSLNVQVNAMLSFSTLLLQELDTNVYSFALRKLGKAFGIPEHLDQQN